MIDDEEVFFALVQFLEFLAVDDGHELRAERR
jgi:hypothetical protein